MIMIIRIDVKIDKIFIYMKIEESLKSIGELQEQNTVNVAITNRKKKTHRRIFLFLADVCMYRRQKKKNTFCLKKKKFWK